MVKIVVKYSPEALDDLDEIEDYYEQFPSSKQISQLFKRVDNLKNQPLIGRPIPELNNDQNIRHIITGNYRIIYHVISEDLLIILRFFHVRRNLNPDSELNFNY